KLAKNVAAEASNFLMGRTFLDIDMARAADLLGMERRQAEQIRDLERGHFLALGPAISRRPIPVRIGSVQTSTRTASHGLLPLPSASTEDLHALLHADWVGEETVRREPEPEPIKAEDLLEQIASHGANDPEEPTRPPDDVDIEQPLAEILAEMAAEEGCTF